MRAMIRAAYQALSARTDSLYEVKENLDVGRSIEPRTAVGRLVRVELVANPAPPGHTHRKENL